jgi:hypothetical protein
MIKVLQSCPGSSSDLNSTENLRVTMKWRLSRCRVETIEDIIHVITDVSASLTDEELQ